MARKRATTTTETRDDHAEAIKWYQERLAAPATYPWVGTPYPPIIIGPTWAVKDGHWVLPEATIGWDVLAWCGTELQHGRDEPWRFTMEQARFLLWWYAVDEKGHWLYHDGVLQRLKGWGKDPVGACILMVEMLGPCRVAEMDHDTPVATDAPNAWVQTAATSLDQTKNTMRLLPGLVTPAAKAHYGLQIGKELVHALDGERLIQAVTSAPASLEGARATCVLKNETQHWLANNSGHEMAAVIERNATKSADGAARTLAITNAYEPSEESSAQADREAWELMESGDSISVGLLYDSLEAPPEAPLTPEAAPIVARSICGDSYWLDTDRIVKSILDPRNPPSRSRRFWYNQIHATEDAWTDPAWFDKGKCKGATPDPKDELVMFFDGSKSNDTTGLVACRLSDGLAYTLAMWQKPPGKRGEGWTVPRAEVDIKVRETLDRLNVVAFWGDPSHAQDDESGERYWDALFDGWHQDYGDKLECWAMLGKERGSGHAIMWDMTSPARTAEFTAAAERCAAEIEDGDVLWDGDPRLRSHVRNAKKFPNAYGVSLWKGHRMSKRKVDLAVCLVGARMLRRRLLNMPRKKKRTGVVW